MPAQHDRVNNHRVHTHPGIPGIYLILIALLESPGVVLDFNTPLEKEIYPKHFENNS